MLCGANASQKILFCSQEANKILKPIPGLDSTSLNERDLDTRQFTPVDLACHNYVDPNSASDQVNNPDR